MNLFRKFRSLKFSAIARILVFAVASLFLAITVGVTADKYSQAEGYVLPSGAIVGGDYVAFDGAAEAIARGQAAEIYDREAFETLLAETGPPRDGYKLFWQYPPSYYFWVAPLALTDYIPGLILWVGLGALVFLFAMRGAGASWLALYVVVASPVVFHAAITGQNGFLTATLIAIAALYPDKRPVLAGLAAALLTAKPHLGLLLPFAYLAAGLWRAFSAAALGTVALVVASALVFGLDSWTAFYTSVGGAGGAWESLAQGVLPVHKMVTPLSAGVFAGLPPNIALGLHLTLAGATIAGVILIWRRVTDRGLRAAALCAGVFLVSPYGYYYETVILALPVLIIVERGLRSGWLRFERLFVALAFVLPVLLPGDLRAHGISWGLVTVVIVAAAVLRRIYHDCPEVMPRLKGPQSTGPTQSNGILGP